MSYQNRILVLQESMRLLDQRIESMDKTIPAFTEAIQQKVTLEREINRLQRLEFEWQNERIDLDDDR